jgi:hypothetical protein
MRALLRIGLPASIALVVVAGAAAVLGSDLRGEPRYRGVVPMPNHSLPPGDPNEIHWVNWSKPTWVIFQGRNLTVPSGTTVASDGTSFLYASTDPSVTSKDLVLACMKYDAPGASGSFVLTDAHNCTWDIFPGVGGTGPLLAQARGANAP